MSKALKVGIFLTAGVVLFCVGLFLIGSRAQLFGHHFVVYSQFKNVDTLQTGAMVRVAGMDAGQIVGIEIPKSPSSEFRLKLDVDQKFRAIVREDSQASIETEGMVGNKFVNINFGSQNSPECRGCTLPTQESVSMGQLMREGGKLAESIQSTINDVHHRADTALDNIDSASGRANTLIAAMSPKILNMTDNADAIIAGIHEGKGAAGKLLTDKTVAANVETTIANAKQASANVAQASHKANNMVSQIQQTDLPVVHKTLENAQDMTQQLNQAVGTFLAPGNSNESTAVALNEAAHGMQQTASNLADDTEAIKTNIFFRGFFNRRGFYNLCTITPEKYAASDFVKKPRVRVWIPAGTVPCSSRRLATADQGWPVQIGSVHVGTGGLLAEQSHDDRGVLDQRCAGPPVSGLPAARARGSPVPRFAVPPKPQASRDHANGRSSARRNRKAELGRNMPGAGGLAGVSHRIILTRPWLNPNPRTRSHPFQGQG